MTPESNNPAATRVPTPHLSALLARLGRHLTLQIWLHGIGTATLVVVGLLGFAFLADWALRAPPTLRWIHLAVLLALPAWVLWRQLVSPLGRRPDRCGQAILLERRHAGLQELLSSAVQFQDTPQPSGAPELIARVLARANERAQELEARSALDRRGPLLRFGLGLGALVAALLLCLNAPVHAAIFFQRLVGGDVGWPQKTHLSVSIPTRADHVRVTPSHDPESGALRALHVRLARGDDLPILVRAEGVVPEEVLLSFDGDQELLLSPDGEGLFRTVLRSCQEALAFGVTGGDDRDGLPRVSVEVLQPPDVAGLAIRITPPAYTGLGARLEFDRDVFVPEGAALDIVMLPTPADARGEVRLLPQDRLLELSAAPFPAREEGAAEQPGLAFSWTAVEPLRFRYELRDSSGLPNPDPGLYAVHVQKDREAEVERISPGRSDVDTTVQGAISLRATARDDYGLVRLVWRAERSGSDLVAQEGTLDFEPLPGGAPEGFREAVVARTRLEVADLAGAGVGAVEGEQYLLEIRAWDNRPRSDAGEGAQEGTEDFGRTPPLRVRIVSVDELMRRIQDRLARVRSQAAALEELQRRKSARLRETLVGLESDSPLEVDTATEISVALTGQRRVLGDARALSRELTAIVETVLYARLDEKAGALLTFLDDALDPIADRSFHPEPWQALTRVHAEGRLGTPAFAGRLVSILELGLTLSETEVRSAVEGLEAAGLATNIAEVHTELTRTLKQQQASLETLGRLLERLAEWDNFQSILTLTRDILNRQKSLADRTRQVARDR